MDRILTAELQLDTNCGGLPRRGETLRAVAHRSRVPLSLLWWWWKRAPTSAKTVAEAAATRALACDRPACIHTLNKYIYMHVSTKKTLPFVWLALVCTPSHTVLVR